MKTSTWNQKISSTPLKNPPLNKKSEHTTMADLFLAGTGAVGGTLLKKLRHIESVGGRLRLLGICNSRKARWDDHGIVFDSTLNESKTQKTDWSILTEKLTKKHWRNLIFIDATASEEIARLYPKLFEAGIHIVTPSKLANTFQQSYFDRLQSLARKHNTAFRYETTVGAGLPVISTLQNLIRSGDEIREVSGVISGTMTYLFNQLEQGVPFSKAIKKARKLGYAEPDPRDDFSGEDVARKFLTLGRTLGLKIEREEMKVESLIPPTLTQLNRATFLKRLPNYDSHWEERVLQARNKDKVLRYTGQLKNNNITIGVKALDRASPIGQLKGTDNLIQIYSRHYHQTPLVIQGPGAGKEVTAAGVLADIMDIAQNL